MPAKFANFLFGSVSQGSNDAFAETSVTTGLSVLNRYAYRIRCIHFQAPALPGVDQANYIMAITRRTKSSSSSYYDADSIAVVNEYLDFTTSGTVLQKTHFTWEPVGDVYVVEDTIYFQIDTNATSATNTGKFRMEYDVVTITDAERSALLARTVLAS